ncbi:MAG: hypothetical protein JSS07_06375 [Proteobacteria bacterium]|nr:hypothetical protein [Pseudomonadota bacterium]
MFNLKKVKIYFRAMVQKITYPVLLAIAVGSIASLSGFFILGYSKIAIALVSTLALGAGTIARYALIKYLQYKKMRSLKTQEPLVQYEIDTQVDVQLNDQAMITALMDHGRFNLPSDLIKQIFEFLPIDKSWHVREVSRSFFFIWESTALNNLSNLPIVPALTTNQVLKDLHKKQQDEINYLIENKVKILKGNKESSEALNIILQKLSFLKNKTSAAACQAKERHLNHLNEIIIRTQLDVWQKSEKPDFFQCAYEHLTRFPSEIFSDSTLSEFWSKVTKLDLYGNHLTSLPESIGVCTNLKWFRVFENELTSLPETLIKSTTLETMSITENCFLSLPDNLSEALLADHYMRAITKTACLNSQKKHGLNNHNGFLIT